MNVRLKFASLGLLAVAAANASALTISGGSMTTVGGFPWVMPNTNYNYVLSDRTSQVSGTNAGDGNFATSDPIGLSNWFKKAETPIVKISGSVDLTSAVGSTYFQVGLVGLDTIQDGFDWYRSAMFNNSAFINFDPVNGASAGDTAGLQSSALGGPLTGNYNFNVLFDLNTNQVTVNVLSGGNWFSASRSIGVHNWGGSDDFSQFGILINTYNETQGLSSTYRFGDMTVEAVPEPFTMALGGAAAAAFIRKRRKAQKA